MRFPCGAVEDRSNGHREPLSCVGKQPDDFRPLIGQSLDAAGHVCEETLDVVGRAAGRVKVPVFAFLEGDADKGRAAFELIAKNI